MIKILLTLLVAGIVIIRGAPAGDFEASGSAQVSGSVPKILSFDNGNVGVNFLGFKASAGLGGLLTGDSSAGGLHAEAGTPFGQAARAGLGGYVEGSGKSVGGLYADATAGGDVAAGAGLAGSAGAEGSHGVSYAGASAGGVYKSKVKAQPVVVETQKEIEAPVVFHKHFEISSAPVVEKQVVEKEVVPEVKPQKTYIERTVIPRFEEKTIYVPSYVEKTIRVPTVVEKKVKVPATPTIVEKRVEAPPANIKFEKSVEEKIVEPAPAPVYVQKVRTRPFFRKHFFLGGGYGGGYNAGYEGNYDAGYGGNYYGEGYKAGNVEGGGSFAVRKSVNPDFINNIFNVRK